MKSNEIFPLASALQKQKHSNQKISFRFMESNTLTHTPTVHKNFANCNCIIEEKMALKLSRKKSYSKIEKKNASKTYFVQNDMKKVWNKKKTLSLDVTFKMLCWFSRRGFCILKEKRVKC
jgi:hypothetical protein